MEAEIDEENFDRDKLEAFSQLDDYDMMSAIKEWCHHKDKVLSYLCKSIVNRRLPKIEMRDQEFDKSYIDQIKSKVKKKLDLDDNELEYLVYHGSAENKAYNSSAEHINIIYKNGDLKNIVQASDTTSIEALSRTVRKYFVCYPKKLL